MCLGENFKKLEETITRLCGEGGCPWDQKQTHLTLKKYLIEEAYEVLEAIDNRDDEALKEELGDVLYQILFHCQIAEKEGRFDINSVIISINEKMIRRHPHVFADRKTDSIQEIKDRWEEIKLEEKSKKDRLSVVDGIPVGLPALQKAQKLQKKVAKVGFEWDSVDGVIEKIEEELDEVKEAISGKEESKVSEELGDLMFAVVNLARYMGKEAEYLLHDAVKKFTARFRYVEDGLKAQNKSFADSSLEEMESLWNAAKVKEGKE